ncbi:unnamed protein product [Adineta steineri]|uniref:ubiquitinyl hydrolase 1 n=1 Tax=Adineta steineri TaxID=433720 RepID=A0A818TKS7_9BILA|nr:unnamed protein product [Adineta steineri]CAF1500271.1 unnamed protein product [Adineta steineri]CAF3628587.1 unnamed protein product [Adineta steineri]CAF3688562.1 unnamed protein product [Adineta steineri]
MWSKNITCASAGDVKKALCQYMETFADYAQHDAHEFISAFIDALHDELCKESLSSIITDQFNIKIKSTVKCLTCTDSQTGDELIKFLSLPLPDHTEQIVHLSSLLDSFEKEEDLDGDIYCNACGNIGKGRQQSILEAPLPPVIIIQLKRFPFDETSRKIDTIIDYPYSNVNFERQEYQEDEHLYDLIAVSLHSGSLASGHYTAFARHNSNHEWYYFNDLNYELIDDPNRFLRKREAYVLIYAKKSVLK